MNERAHRRKLGQNYLIDPVILFEIERAINPQKNNCFFEIGPARFTFIQTAEAKNRIKPSLDEGNIEKTMNAPSVVIISYILKTSLDFLYEGRLLES